MVIPNLPKCTCALPNQSHYLNVPMVFTHSSNLHRISDLYLLYLLARYNAPGIRDLYLLYLLARYNAPGIMAVTLDLLGLIAENVHLYIHALHTTDKEIW